MLDRRSVLKMGSAGLLCGLAGGALPFQALAKAGNTPAPLYLHFNENSLGMSPKAKAAADNALLVANRYPDPLVETLIADLAKYLNVNENMVMLGNGSTELLHSSVLAVDDGNGLLVQANPTYGVVAPFARGNGVKVINTPLTHNHTLDLEALEQASKGHNGPVLAYICNPNNPTGTIVPSADIRSWAMRAPSNVLFLIDEAYHDYVTDERYESALSLVNEGFDNVYVTRTFSKVHGMAGLRIGYGIGTEKMITRIKAVTAFDNTNGPGLAAASAALSDSEWIAKSIKSNADAKRILLQALVDLDLRYMPSETNFVMHEISNDLEGYRQRMTYNGVMVGRQFPSTEGWNRLSIGTPDEMLRFTSILKNFRKNGWI